MKIKKRRNPSKTWKISKTLRMIPRLKMKLMIMTWPKKKLRRPMLSQSKKRSDNVVKISLS